MQTHDSTRQRGGQAASVDIHDHTGRRVGSVRNGTLYKSISGSVGIMRKTREIAFDVASLHEAEAAGAERVEVTDRETGTVYRVALGTLWAKGRPLDLGWGKQWALLIREFSRDGEPAADQLALAL
jgi:hypothetical protein